ncbi:MAG: hypothetical protein WBE78_15210, partial [Candidatus Binataceae bacterium]
ISRPVAGFLVFGQLQNRNVRRVSDDKIEFLVRTSVKEIAVTNFNLAPASELAPRDNHMSRIRINSYDVRDWVAGTLAPSKQAFDEGPGSTSRIQNRGVTRRTPIAKETADHQINRFAWRRNKSLHDLPPVV